MKSRRAEFILNSFFYDSLAAVARLSRIFSSSFFLYFQIAINFHPTYYVLLYSSPHCSDDDHDHNTPISFFFR